MGSVLRSWRDARGGANMLNTELNLLVCTLYFLVLDITQLLLYVIITDLYDHTTILPIVGQYNHRQS